MHHNRHRPAGVKAGTYQEEVNVTTDYLSIEGDGASSTVLMPPAMHTAPCDDPTGLANVGICVANTPNPDGSVRRVVKGFRAAPFLLR